MGGVFISYRRADSQGSTGRIADRLHQILGDEIPLFLDIDSIRPGEDFRDVISDTLTKCDVTLIMIGPRWLEATDSDGNVRLEDEGDLHRMEVESALSSSATAIPVLVEGASMPGPDDLPESIRELAYLHAAEVSVRRFASDAEYLADLIRAVIATGPEEPSREPVPPPESAAAPEPVAPAPAPPSDGAGSDRRGPDRRVLIAGAIAALLVLIVIAIALTGDDGGDGPPVAQTTLPADTVALDSDDPAGVDVFSLAVGDCFGEVESHPVSSVVPQDCAGLHANEVFAVWSSFTATLPNDDTLLEGCVARFDDAVGIPYDFSAYYVAGFWPDAERWADGNTTVICYGFVRDGQGVPIATTGSMLGSGN